MDLDALMGAFGPMQDKLKAAEARRAEDRIEGSAGGGAVRIRLRGNLTMDGVSIAPAAASAVGDDPSMLEDLIQAACDDALRQYRSRYGATAQEQFQKLMGDTDLGSMFGGLFQ